MARTLPSPTAAEQPFGTERTPARVTLASAIERREALKLSLADAKAEAARALTVWSDAFHDKEGGEELLERALPRDDSDKPMPFGSNQFRVHQHVDHERLERIARLPRLSVPEAREKLATASDLEASAKRERQDTAGQVSEIETRLRYAEDAVKTAVQNAAVADPAFAALRLNALRFERAARDARGALRLVGASDRYTEGDLREVAQGLPEDEREPLVTGWKAALEKLRDDADVQFPS